jgi:hypothetical protein
MKAVSIATAAIGVAMVVAFAATSQPSLAPVPAPAAQAAVLPIAGAVFTAEGRLQRPLNYRDWKFVSAGLGMSYGPAAQAAALAGHVMFDNVFVQPQAYQSFLKDGVWPEGTMFVLELRGTGTERPPNNRGYFQTGIHGVEVSVKDSKRFRGRWAYFDFGTGAKAAAPLPESGCFDCHRRHAAVDMTFVQFYPTLQDVKPRKQP